MKKILIVLLVISLAACGDGNEVKNVALGVEFTLNQGDAAIVSESEIRLDVVRLSDSRCPEGAQCIWEGEAKVLFTFEFSGGVVKTDSLSSHNRSIVEIDDYSIELIDLTPYPVVNKKVKNQTVALIIREN